MEGERKIKIEGKVSFAEEADIDYWANLPVTERLRQAFDWKKKFGSIS